MRAKANVPWFLSPGAIGFVAGFAVGAVGIAVLAAWSSRLYLESSRLLFSAHESGLVGERLREGDLEGALVHAAARLEAEHGSASARVFGAEREAWSVGFALREALRDRRIADLEPKTEFLHRLPVAALWEELGRPEAAGRELDRVGEVSGSPDRDRWRAAGRLLLVNACRSAEGAAGTDGRRAPSACDRFARSPVPHAGSAPVK